MANTSQKAKSNLEIYVGQVVERIKARKLHDRFYDLADNPSSRKVTMRLDYDLYTFYTKMSIGYQTAMKLALRVVKEAIEKQELNLPK